MFGKSADDSSAKLNLNDKFVFPYGGEWIRILWVGGMCYLDRLQCFIFNVHGCLIGFALKIKEKKYLVHHINKSLT